MFKLNQEATYANKMGTGEWHNVESSTEYLKWLSEGNTPEPADQPDPKEAIKAQIAELEAKITPRRIREALLSGDTAYIVGIDTEIAALRSQL